MAQVSRRDCCLLFLSGFLGRESVIHQACVVFLSVLCEAVLLCCAGVCHGGSGGDGGCVFVGVVYVLRCNARLGSVSCSWLLSCLVCVVL